MSHFEEKESQYRAAAAGHLVLHKIQQSTARGFFPSAPRVPNGGEKPVVAIELLLLEPSAHLDVLVGADRSRAQRVTAARGAREVLIPNRLRIREQTR